MRLTWKLRYGMGTRGNRKGERRDVAKVSTGSRRNTANLHALLQKSKQMQAGKLVDSGTASAAGRIMLR